MSAVWLFIMSNSTEGVCRNFPYVFKGDFVDYISAIATSVIILNSSFVSGVGNVAVTYVLFSTRSLWKNTLVFTINFAFVNFFTAVFCIPTYFAFLVRFVHGTTYCTLGAVSFVLYRFCLSTTVVNISLISYQRFASICYPYRYQSLLTLQRHVYIAIASWFYGLILTIPLVAEVEITPWPAFMRELCFASKLILLLHMATTVLCYARMGCIASSHRRRISQNFRHVRRLLRTKKTSVYLVGTLLVSTLPWLGLTWIKSWHSILLECCTRTLFFTSCFFNLFLYTLRNEDIDAAIKRTINRKIFPQNDTTPRIRITVNTRAENGTLHLQVHDITTTQGRWLQVSEASRNGSSW